MRIKYLKSINAVVVKIIIGINAGA